MSGDDNSGIFLLKVIVSKSQVNSCYMFRHDVNVSSAPSIGHRFQHKLIQMLLPYIAPGVSLTMIALPWFGVVEDSFALCLLTRKKFSLYRLCLDTLCSLNTVLLLFMNHIYMMISLTVSLTTLMFSFALRSLTAQCHWLSIHIRLRGGITTIMVRQKGVRFTAVPVFIYALTPPLPTNHDLTLYSS